MPFAPGPPTELGGAPPSSGLGQRLINGVRWTVGQVYNPIAERIGRATDNTVKRWYREAGDAVNDAVEAALTKFENAANAPDLRSAVRAMLDPLPLALIIPAIGAFLIGLLSSAGTSLFNATFKRILANLNFAANRAVPTFRISAEDGIAAERRGALDLAQIRLDLADLGVDEARAEALIAQSYRWLSTSQIEDMFWRGLVDEAHARTLLAGIGITDEQVDLTMRTFERLVPLSDLIRMAVRNVFQPEFAERLREPVAGDRFYEQAALLGMNRERAEWFWMAHWDIPSFTQGAQMVQRMRPDVPGITPFTTEDLERLLRWNDMAKEFIPGMLEIAYRAPNRLDIWRLATSQKIDEETAFAWYQDYGYKPALARTMAQLATAEKRTLSRDFTQAQIVKLYKQRAFSRDEATAALTDIGFASEIADLYLASADYDLAEQRASRRSTVIRQRYLAGLISEADVVNQLLDLGKPADEVEELATLWREQRQDRIERPTVSQLLGMYRDRVISGPDCAAEISLHGYDDRYVAWYIAQADADIADAEARKSEADNRRTLVAAPVPTRGDLANWLRRGIIAEDEFYGRLQAQGYQDADIRAYAAAVRLPVTLPFYGSPEGRVRTLEAKQSFRRALLTGAELRLTLQGLGYPAELADAIADYEELRIAPAA